MQNKQVSIVPKSPHALQDSCCKQHPGQGGVRGIQEPLGDLQTKRCDPAADVNETLPPFLYGQVQNPLPYPVHSMPEELQQHILYFFNKHGRGIETR
ncbi:UNVERIFIED_CONTAM: hypothetical protein FKN15_045889 [Acipenser sinensis]